MKTLKGLPANIARDKDESQFPFHTIQNETATQPGTPVVREIYGDILTNVYALLIETGVVPSETEDNETNGYQILTALKKLANTLNDVEQVLTLTGTIWSVPLAIDRLPNKYIFIARATEDYNDAVSYTITGTDTNSYNFTSNGFNASDIILVVLDQAGARAVSLSQGMTESEVFTPFGMPLAFNDSAKMYYEEDGALLTDAPSINYLQSAIRVTDGDGTLVVYNMFIAQSHVLCFCYLPSTQTYKFYQFALTDLATPQLVAVSGITIPTGVNREPYAFTDGSIVYLSNQAGTSDDDFELAGFTYDADAQTLALSVSRTLANTFVKSTNTVIQGTDLVTFIGGELKKYNLGTGVESDLGEYNSFLGVLFRYNGATYYSNGEIAKQWTV